MLRDDELPAFIIADEEEVTGHDGGGAGHVTGGEQWRDDGKRV